MAGAAGSGRVSDLHKSAFWIYGVTAMVMREPLANVIRHTAASGLGSYEVQVELLRVMAILALMSRLFLASGLYFDEVHLRPEASALYARRSYPVDFLAGLLQFLLLVGASTAIALAWPFAAMVGAFLLFENFWCAISAMTGLSTASRVSQMARGGRLAFLVCGLIYLAAAGAGLAQISQILPLVVLLALTFLETARLVRAYDRSPAQR